MIRQLCPNCVQLVELPDDAAGDTVVCPRCARPFPVPEAYTPTVDAAAGPTPAATAAAAVPTHLPVPDRPAPPPGFVPPGSPAPPPTPPGPTAPPVAVPTPAGYTHAAGFALTPQGLGWVPVACLTVVLALSFFPWVGSYPGGVRMYSQVPWQAAFGYFTANPLAAGEEERALRGLVAMDWWLVLYVLVLVPTAFLAWAERLVRTPNPAPGTLPAPVAWLANIWPQRFPLLSVLTVLLLVVLLVQLWRGFGLEQAVETLAVQNYEQAQASLTEQERAAANTVAAEQRGTVAVGQGVGRFVLDGTTALSWSVVAHLVAVAAALGLWWLDRRGPKPAPQLRAYW